MKRLFIAVLMGLMLAAVAPPAGAAIDPHRPRQWGLDRIQAEKAWAVSKGVGIRIAIVDSGIDLNHPDLKGNVSSAVTCIRGACKTGGNDDNGHGSHVAGIAAASTGNGTGIAGVAPSAKLMAVKVLDADGNGDCRDIDRGIRWSVDHGADVINLSLGPEIGLVDTLFGGDCVTAIQGGAQYAWNKGAVVVAAAGNDSLRSVYESSALIVVGATGPSDRPAYYSSSDADIFAPGGDAVLSCSEARCIFSTWLDGYRLDQGTSMAAPHISGVAALLLARGYSKTQVLSRIRNSADDVNGTLRVNAARAVGSVAGTKPTKSASQRASARPSRARAPTQVRGTTTDVLPPGLSPMPLSSGGKALSLGRDDAPITWTDGPPSRTIFVSVAAGLAMLTGAGFVGRFWRAAV